MFSLVDVYLQSGIAIDWVAGFDFDLSFGCFQ